MRNSPATTSTFGCRLRKLAGTLSATSQATNMNEYVVRFFSTSNPAERSAALASLQAAQAKQRQAASSIAEQQQQQQQQQQHQSTQPAAVPHRKSPPGTSAVLDLTTSDASSLPLPASPIEEAAALTATATATGDRERSSAPDRRYPDERDDPDATPQEVYLRKQPNQQQQHRDEEGEEDQPEEKQELKRSSDTRTLVDVFDELVGQQLADQPDDDVISIVVRNDDAGRRLFQFLLTGEMWYLPLNGVDVSALSEEDWQQMRGAKLALDSLVRPLEDENQRPKICLSRREDLAVFRMPQWQHGVGASLETMRNALLDAQRRLDAQLAELTSTVAAAGEGAGDDAEKVPLNSLMLVPPAEETFVPRPDLGDVLSVPFEPNGMRIELANGHLELSALSLHALSDKRQATDPIDPEVGEIVANRFQIDQKVGSATFSDAFAVTMLPDAQQQQQQQQQREEQQQYPTVACIKVIKPEFFDQALDEVRLLNSINELAQARYEHAIRILDEYRSHQEEGNEEQQQPSAQVLEANRIVCSAGCGADAYHVVKLSDAFYFRHRMFVVTELLKENLYETTCASLAAEQEGTESYWFDISRLAMVAQQVTTALELVHSLNLLHCDVKPENIMVQSHSRCRVKLIDYGSSSYLHERFSSYVQSRSYRAPEVVVGAPYDSRADVWSLGAVMVELAARGEILFRSTTLSNMMARVAAVCGPVPSSLAHAGYHADCLALRSGVFFAQYPEADDERFEKFEQHPFYYTAQGVRDKADGMRVAVEQGNAGADEASPPESERSHFDEKTEVWLHFPVYKVRGSTSRGASPAKRDAAAAAVAAAAAKRQGPEEEEGVQERQALWQKVRHGATVAEWMDIYEPSGRLEAMLEQHGGWTVGLTLSDERNWKQPVLPELLFLDFVKKCLIVEPTLRPTTAQLLTHPFLSVFAVQEEEILMQGINAMQAPPPSSAEEDPHFEAN